MRWSTCSERPAVIMLESKQKLMDFYGSLHNMRQSTCSFFWGGISQIGSVGRSRGARGAEGLHGGALRAEVLITRLVMELGRDAGGVGMA